MQNPKILFISRAYPPIVGGIENQNYELSQWLPKHADVTTIANTAGKIALPFFLPFTMLRLLVIMRNYDVLLLGDGVLAIVGWWTKIFFPQKKVTAIIHGLDITYQSALYQILWVQWFLPRLSSFIAVGNQTRDMCIARGFPVEKVTFIPNGIDPAKFFPQTETATDLSAIIGEQNATKKTILTSGRLARRKGVAWFIRNVLPSLPDDIIYIVAGDGPDRENVAAAITQTDAQERVIALGYVSDEIRQSLFHSCDVFVQPNIPIDGDIEGFGISVIEAAASGIPVIAAHLEGLKDAIINGKSGFSIPPQDPTAWQTKITEVLAPDFDRKAFGQSASVYVTTNNSWDHIASLYIQELEK